MADQDTLPRKDKKFLFDQNNFDDGSMGEPSRPVQTIFSLKEVEDIQKKAHARGVQEGMTQSAATREEKIASILKTMGASLTSLLTAEGARAAFYESETIALVRAIFAKLFPGLNERHGLEEVTRMVTAVLESQRSQPEIIVEVHPDYVDAIHAHAEALTARFHGGAACTVKGNESLGPGDCRLSWRDGGGLRDAAGLAEQIGAQLEQALADQAALRDNGPQPVATKPARGAAKKGDKT